jgi:hypothetical protein
MMRWNWLLLLAACGADSQDNPSDHPLGPDGQYGVYLRCAPYYGHICDGPEYAEHPYYFQCDEAPGDACIDAPRPSPDPDQSVWCCSFACSRGDPERDFRCNGKALYTCTSDATIDEAFAAARGCELGYDSNTICC